jgi:putative integral membrane protein (TIGR02587 family)
LQDVLRAVGGGFIFATPLLYTMEMWWIGSTAELWKLLLFLLVAALISLALARSRSGGFKEETSSFASIEQAVDGVAMGLIGAVIVLTVLNRIQLGDPLDGVLGKVIVQAVPITIGSAVANTIFGPHGERSRAGDEERENPRVPDRHLSPTSAPRSSGLSSSPSRSPPPTRCRRSPPTSITPTRWR